MHADWIQSIERQLAEVPPGCLLELSLIHI